MGTARRLTVQDLISNSEMGPPQPTAPTIETEEARDCREYCEFIRQRMMERARRGKGMGTLPPASVDDFHASR